MINLKIKDVRMRYDILLSVHAMEEVVKLDLAISKKPVLLLSQTLQGGLVQKGKKTDMFPA